MNPKIQITAYGKTMDVNITVALPTHQTFFQFNLTDEQLAKLGVTAEKFREVLQEAVDAEETRIKNEPKPVYGGKSIYLKHPTDPEIVGLHESGEWFEHEGLEQFYVQEAWVNIYDKDMKFKASVARIYEPIEEYAKDFQEGWTIFRREEGKGDVVTGTDT